MGKEKPGFLTAKAISNRIKAKGLQRLRWYCQMCQKQCRDENGFKCHIMSEAHHRQMLIFDENPDRFVGNYTRDFMKGYLDILKRQFGGKRTNANLVYQEYIKDKEHIHMNATKFTTLTGFINCLHKMGICKVDNTDNNGWFIQYIDKNPDAEYQEKKKRRLEKLDELDEKHFFELFENSKSILDECQEQPCSSEFVRNEDEVIKIDFMKSKSTITNINAAFIDNDEADKIKEKCDDIEMIKSTKDIKNDTLKRKHDSFSFIKPTREREIKHINVLDEIIHENEKNNDQNSRKKYWMHEGILVKLIDERLPKELLNQNAVVKSLEDKFTAIVKTVNLEMGNQKKMRVVQENVMTVIPKTGSKVLIVNGAYRESKAILIKSDKHKLTGDLKLISGLHSDRVISNISYDDFSKLYEHN